MNKTNTYYLLCYSVLFTLVTGEALFAQQIPIFNQYLYYPEFYNPAATGDGFIAIQYRNQFSDLDSRNAPKSYAVFADFSPVLGLSQKRIGIGLSLISDEVHIVNRLKGKFSFAYQLIKNENNKLSAGIEAGLFTQRMNFKDIRISDPQDIILYDGTVKKSIFDGGFGLRYLYKDEAGKEFNFNLATPQLFTSDLVYEEGSEFEINPHLLTTISYKIPIGSAAIEPIVMYREILGKKKLKEGQIDLGLRASFLADRIWLGSGFRLEAASYHFSLGFQIVDKLHFTGTFETHSALGNTWEMGLTYRFDREKNEKVNIDNSEAASLSIEDQLAQLEAKTKISKTEVLELSDQANQKIREADAVIQTAKGHGTDPAFIQAEIRKADAALVDAKSLLEKAVAPATLINKSITEGAVYYKEAHDKNTASKKLNRSWEAIQEQENQSNQTLNNLIYSYSQLSRELADLKSRTKTEGEQAFTLKGNNDVVALQAYFQKELNAALGVSENAMPVEVTNDGRVLKLKYQYAHNQPDFKLERSLNEPRFMADQINEQIKTLQANNFKVNNIIVAAQLQSRKSAMEETILSTRYEESMFGPSVNISYQFFDELEQTIQPMSKVVYAGQINLLDLACLKLYGLKRYFERNGTAVSKIPVSLELRAPNYEQIHPEIYSITIEFK